MNILLIDSSYTSFYRFFATVRWYSFAYKEHYNEIKSDVNYDWLSNKIFTDTYSRMYLDSIKKLVKPKIFNNSYLFFCQDDHKCKLWRNKIHENYKEGRQDLTLKFNFKPVFEYTYKTLIPKFISDFKNIFAIKVECVEADDIIAVMANLLKNVDIPTFIISGDDDFTQLGRKNLYIVDYKTKKIKNLSEEESKKELYKKIINGDKSDNINSIFKDIKISNKNKKEIIEDENKLFDFLKNNTNAKKQYEENQKLIDFNFIPKSIKKKIMKKIDEQFNIANPKIII